MSKQSASYSCDVSLGAEDNDIGIEDDSKLQLNHDKPTDHRILLCNNCPFNTIALKDLIEQFNLSCDVTSKFSEVLRKI